MSNNVAQSHDSEGVSGQPIRSIHPSTSMKPPHANYKDCTEGKNACSSEVGPSSSTRHAELPDINEDPPVVDEEPSSSRTQSLDVNRVFSKDENSGTDPNIRWVKRLKTNSSDSFAHGTKSSKLEASHKKVKKFFEILKGTLDANHSAQQMVPFTEPVKKGKHLTLSHSWVRRWCRNQDLPPLQKTEAVVICEPQRSTKASQDFLKEQVPSIAAIGINGKLPCSVNRME